MDFTDEYLVVCGGFNKKNSLKPLPLRYSWVGVVHPERIEDVTDFGAREPLRCVCECSGQGFEFSLREGQFHGTSIAYRAGGSQGALLGAIEGHRRFCPRDLA